MTYKLIKRQFKITDSNIADFFGYKNRISFLTSSLRGMVVTHIERTYARYLKDGVKGAAAYAESVVWPSSTVSHGRVKQYKAGLLEFIDVVNHQTKTGKFVDPLNRPRKPWQKNKPLKYKL